jgi:hypothetical protein
MRFGRDVYRGKNSTLNGGQFLQVGRVLLADFEYIISQKKIVFCTVKITAKNVDKFFF